MNTIDDHFDISSCSELSSLPSRSPSPPSGYPSPPPAKAQVDGSPATGAPTQKEPSTPKKRRRPEPKPRITRHLDLTLSAAANHVDQSATLEVLLKALRKKKKIVVVAGAGISVSAGIPDFRSSNGLFSSLKKDHKLKASGKQLFDISVYQEESTTSSFHDMVRSLSSMAKEAEPTLFHHLLARLAREGRLKRLYTQNVDEIDTSLPPLRTEVPLGLKAPWPRTIQLHGGLKMMVCQKCRHTSDLEPERFEGPCPPLCNLCKETEMARTTVGQRSHGVGTLRPRIVLYNEHSPDEEAIGSVVTADLRARPDCLIVVGTSLKIPGVRRIVREMSRVVRGRKDGLTVWINRDSMPVGKEFADCWDLIVKGDSDEVARHAGLKKWDDNSEDIHDTTSSEVERQKARCQPAVEIRTPRKSFRDDNGISTPSASNDDISRVQPDGPIPMKSLADSASSGSGGCKSGNTGSKAKVSKAAAPKKPAQKRRKIERTSKDQSRKITQTFRVGKSTKTDNPKPIKSEVVVKDEEPHKPMEEVSPGDPRSNTLVQSEHIDTPSKMSPAASRPPKGLEAMIHMGPENT